MIQYRVFLLLAFTIFASLSVFAQQDSLLDFIADSSKPGLSYLELGQQKLVGAYELYEAAIDIKTSVDKLIANELIRSDFEGEQFVIVSPKRQVMFFFNYGDVHLYLVSTSNRGLGEVTNSYKTPRGAHRIKVKIGSNLPNNAIIKGRVFTGDIWSEDSDKYEGKDLVLTRILWLEGLESANATSYSRYIYFHGTNNINKLGSPASRGCIRMGLDELLEFYDAVSAGIVVDILNT